MSASRALSANGCRGGSHTMDILVSATAHRPARAGAARASGDGAVKPLTTAGAGAKAAAADAYVSTAPASAWRDMPCISCLASVDAWMRPVLGCRPLQTLQDFLVQNTGRGPKLARNPAPLHRAKTSSYKSARTVRKYEKHSAETLICVSFRMSFRPVRRRSAREIQSCRVPMETLHVILVVSGPSSKHATVRIF